MQEKFVIRISLSLFTQIFNLIINYLLILRLDVEYVGIINFTTSFLGIFIFFIDLGLSQIYLQSNAKKNFGEYFSVFFLLKTILIISNFGSLFITILLLNLEEKVYNYLFLLFFSFLIDNFANIWMINLESKLKIIKKSIVDFLTYLIRGILILFIIFNIKLFSNVLIYLGWIYIISSFLSCIFLLILSRGEFYFKKLNKKIVINFIKMTKPLIFSSIISVIVTNIGNIVLDISLGHEALAYFSIINNYIIDLLLLISFQVLQIFSTYFPKEFENNKIEDIKKMTYIVEKYSSIFFLSTIIFVLFNGKLVFELFLPKYINSLIYLYILIFIPFIAGINRPYTAHLIPSKRQKLISIYSIFRNITEIILIVIVIPKNIFSIKALGLGGIGLALVKLSGWVVDIFFYRYFSKKIGISANRRILFYVLYAFVALFITNFIAIFILEKLLQKGFLFLIISSVILFGIFFIELIIFRELKREDWKSFLSIFKISIYKKSINDEMEIS